MKLKKAIFDHFLKLISLLGFLISFTHVSVDLLAQNGNYYPESSFPKIPFVSEENNLQQYNFSFSDNANYNFNAESAKNISALQNNVRDGADFVPLGYYTPLTPINDFINSVTPLQNDINVNKSSNIEIIFLLTMNSSTINSSNIKVFGARTGLMNYAITYEALEKKATINPNTDFKAGEEISVILNSGIKNFSGDSLTPFGYSFTVAATQGTGTFTENLIIQDTTLQCMTSGDIDGDGDIDIVASFDKIVYPGIHYKAINVYKRQLNGNYYKTQIFFEQYPNPENTVFYLDLQDMDNDGFLDVAGQTDGLGSFILIAYNDGSGNFGNIQTIPVDPLSFAKPFLIADFDNDGDNDILSFGCAYDMVAIFSNIGNHQFETVCLNLNQFGDYEFMTCNDYDNDGDIDIINSSEVLLNSGNFYFSRLENAVPPGFTGVMEDFDHDGDLDMITSYSSQIYLYRNNGNGIFSDSTLIASSNYSITKIAEDFNADGSFDLLLHDDPQNKYAVFKNNGSGYFTLLSLIEIDYSLFQLISNDVDSDGDIDILGFKHNGIYSFLNNPTNQTIQFSLNPNINAINVIKSTDITIQFGYDMNASTLNSSNIKIFGSQTGLLSSTISYNAGTKTATANPDNDFKAGEKIFVTLTSGIQYSTGIAIMPINYSFTVAATSGTGIFADRMNPYVNYGNTNIIIPGDFDKDGDLDLCVVNTFNGHNNLGILTNNNAGVFHIISDYILFNVDILSVVSGDFDNDGDIDLAVCFTGSLDISIYKNNGFGTFNLASTSPGLGGIFMDLGDFDSDGDIDLVSVKNESIGFGVIRISFNDGSGNFGTHNILASSCSCPVYESFHSFGDLTVSDYDNDGDLDIVVVGAQDDFFIFNCHCIYVTLFKNSGSGNFTGVDITPPDYSHFIISDDINGDRYEDLIFSPGHIYKNNNLNFSYMSYPGKGGNILAGDYDGDGDLDIAEQYTDSNNFNIYKNNGMEIFNLHSTKSVSFGAGNAFASGDFEGDGDIDIASSNSEPGTLSILLNNYHVPLFVSPPSPPCGSVFMLEPPYPSAIHFTLEVTDSDPVDIITLDAIQLPLDATITPSLPITGNPINSNFILTTSNPGIANFKATDQSGNETTCMIYFDFPTPVELTSFTSIVIQRNVKLIWETAAEQNNSGFEIERSIVKLQTSNEKGETSIEWNKIGFVQGHGTTINLTNYLFEDKNLSFGKYKYRLKQIDYNGNFHYYDLQNEVTIGIPEKFSLSQNYPNPFNPTTKINFDLPYEGIVKIKLFDNTGREIAVILNEFRQAGYYTHEFNAVNLSSGVYFYRIEFGKNVMTKQMMLIK